MVTIALGGKLTRTLNEKFDAKMCIRDRLRKLPTKVPGSAEPPWPPMKSCTVLLR